MKKNSLMSLKKGPFEARPRVWPPDPVNQVRLDIRDFLLQMLLNSVPESELLGLVPTSLEHRGIEVIIPSRSVRGIKAAVLANVNRWPGETRFTLVRGSDFEQTESLPDDERNLLNTEVVVRFTVLGGLPTT